MSEGSKEEVTNPRHESPYEQVLRELVEIKQITIKGANYAAELHQQIHSFEKRLTFLERTTSYGPLLLSSAAILIALFNSALLVYALRSSFALR
jgi:hypothetical protein